jgi:hypothetical protein
MTTVAVAGCVTAVAVAGCVTAVAVAGCVTAVAVAGCMTAVVVPQALNTYKLTNTAIRQTRNIRIEFPYSLKTFMHYTNKHTNCHHTVQLHKNRKLYNKQTNDSDQHTLQQYKIYK